MGMESSAFAMEFRDIIKRMIAAELERVRPRYRYATVVTIDRANWRATIVYNEGDTPVPVSMTAVQPKQVNQRVRIEGVPNDRYIAAVLGPAVVIT